MNRMMEIAFENGLPLISLVQSVGLFPFQTTQYQHDAKYIKLGRCLPSTTVSGLPQRRPALSRLSHSYTARKAVVRNCLWIFYRGGRISPSLVRLYHFCRESGTGLSRRPSSGENGNGGNCRRRGIGRCQGSCYDNRSR